MSQVRIRTATSKDGTPITGRVQGSGPPLVLPPAGPGDSGTTWRPLLPHLSRHFECHLLDPRGRGLSGDHPDHSPARMVEDVQAYTEGMDGPILLAEWGSFIGGAWGLFAAQDPASPIHAAATYDPLPTGVGSGADMDRLEAVLEEVGDLHARDRPGEAARTFVERMAEHGFYTPEDMADGATFAFWSAARPNIGPFLDELEAVARIAGSGGPDEEAPQPDAADPAALAQTTVPVLVLHGARSHPLNVGFSRYVADALPDARLGAVDGAGHYGPHTHPHAVASELVAFFEGVLEDR